MSSRPRRLVPVPVADPGDDCQLELGERSSLSDAQLRQALIDAGHPATGPDTPYLYPVVCRDDVAESTDQ